MTRTVVPATLLLALVVGCAGKELSLFGYSTAPPFDPDIRSVYIPTFKNIAFVTNPHRGIEVDVTRAIVDELGRRRSPMRVVSDPGRADTELVGTIKDLRKVTLNRNLQNYSREEEIILIAEVVWRDLRSGRVLTNSRPKANADTVTPFDPNVPAAPPPPPEENARPVTVTAIGRMLPELGQSNASAEQMAVQQLAKQIVNMMESPW